MIPQGIDGEYEVIKILHKSAATAVFLVNYKQIGDIRVLKSIDKSSPESNSILSEAHLLQGFKSPQIPTIYSVGETTDSNYLIEEYVNGQSLVEYLQENTIDKAKIIDIAIRICSVIEFMHTSLDEPILYRDMKPDHIILQGSEIKLIDFGISIKKSMSPLATPKGTAKYAAPEQMRVGQLDESCDVYGIGKVIEYMLERSPSKDDYKLKQIVAKATAKDCRLRIQTAGELRNLLQGLRGERVEKFAEKHLSKQIAIIGNDRSVGTTHIAIMLCSYLNKKGLSAYYKDMVGENVVKKLKDNLNKGYTKEGVFYHKHFRGIMSYGPAVKSYLPPQGIYILDYGKTDIMPMTDEILYITSSSPWVSREYPDWVKDESVVVINNFTNKIKSLELAKNLGKPIYVFPEAYDVFSISKFQEKLFASILKNNYEMDY
ncbi:MAG: protein kinase [Pseudobutyrivibrio sp.]|nr:protein kinase [Pseudobutyrivibrio sp.]